MNEDIVSNVTSAMRRENIAAVIAVSPENFAYLTGFIVPSQPLMRWRHAAAVVTRDGGTGLLSVDMEAKTVRSREPEVDVRAWAEFEDNAMLTLAGLLRDLGLEEEPVGIETQYLPGRDMDRLRELLPGVSWEPVDRLFADLRMIKTPREIEIIRRTARISDAAIGEALGAVRAGDTEMDLAGVVTGTLYRLGAEQFKLLIVASGERSQYPNVGPTDRALKTGDLVRLEVFGVVAGYHAGVCRTAVVQQASPEAERIWANFVECRDLLAERIKPGASSAAVYQAFLEKFSELGYEPISFVGHGIGLSLHEDPYLGRYGDWTLEAGMVLGVEPLVYGPGFGLQMKDVVLVTEDGSEWLSDVTNTDRLFVIP